MVTLYFSYTAFNNVANSYVNPRNFAAIERKIIKFSAGLPEKSFGKIILYNPAQDRRE
jgi:hypothetical protein